MDLAPTIAPVEHSDGITIRPLTTPEETEHFQEIERQVWGSADADVVPTHVSVTLAKNGGLVLGAFAADGPEQSGGLVGVALGWLGTGVDPATPDSPPKIKFCSHMAGVLPAWQGKHVGMRLKLAQRDFVLKQGFADWMTWTYDPLFRANGVFNIHRLGATCSTYMRNIYGVMSDDLNRGVPSDRCQVDWRLTSAHVTAKVQAESGATSPHATWGAEMLEILPCGRNRAGFETPGEPIFSGDGRALAVPLPSDISAIRRSDSELSLAWRYYVRTVLEGAFAEGYTMVDCVKLSDPVRAGDYGWRYVLVREYL